MARLRLDRLLATRPSKVAYCPEVGDIIWLEFHPQAGREQDGHRQALVLSPQSYNSITRLCVVCPITTQVKGYPFEVALPNGLESRGVVLSDQVKSLSWDARGAEFVCHSPIETVSEVKGKVAALLQIK